MSVSKLHQVELILEKLLSGARNEKLKDCSSKVKPIDQRMEASKTIMTKQLPGSCKEMNLFRALQLTAKDNANAIKRLQMVEDMKNLGDDALKDKLNMSRVEKRALEVAEASKAFAQKMVENNERAIRRISRINLTLYGGRAKKEKASLFIQAVWNYKIMRNLKFKVRRKHLIILSQNGYRRWHSIRVANALRIQRWLRHIKWGERQMYVVRAEVRDRMRDKLKREKVTKKLKNHYDKIWDVVNARYQYKHRKLPGVILDEKPEIMGGDDILTPRSKRRKNWAEATGGREELNEIEAAHIVVKFMKGLLEKDAGGFLISQQWYGTWVAKRKPNKEQAIVIIQKIIRTQMERWGGLVKFGKRVSHNNALQKRRMKSKNRGKGGLGLKGARPLHEEVPMNIGNVYCPRFWREGEREQQKKDKMRRKLEEAERIRRERRDREGGKGAEKRKGWETFFATLMRSSTNGMIAKLMETKGGVGVGGGEVEKGGKNLAQRKKERKEEEERVKRAAEQSWQEMVKQRTQVFGDLVGGEGEEGGDGGADALSEKMATMTKSYRNFSVGIVTRGEKVKKEEEEVEEGKEEEEEEGKEGKERNFRKTRKTIKFSDEKDDDDSDGSNVLIVGEKNGGKGEGKGGGILKPKSSFKFQSFDDIMKDLDLDSDEDDELGLKDVGDDDDEENENVFVV